MSRPYAELVFELSQIKDAHHSFPVIVDRNKSLAELITAGEYAFFDHRITEENCLLKTPGVFSVEVSIFSFGRDTSASEVVCELKRLGYTPASVQELVCLGNDFPIVPQLHQTVALGTDFYPSLSKNFYCYLYGGNGQRKLGMTEGRNFGAQWWFAATKI